MQIHTCGGDRGDRLISRIGRNVHVLESEALM